MASNKLGTTFERCWTQRAGRPAAWFGRGARYVGLEGFSDGPADGGDQFIHRWTTAAGGPWV